MEKKFFALCAPFRVFRTNDEREKEANLCGKIFTVESGGFSHMSTCLFAFDACVVFIVDDGSIVFEDLDKKKG
jgi:hypothetical protein